VGDERDAIVVALGAADLRRKHWPDRLEAWVAGLHLAVLLEDLHELAEVRGRPMAARALALLEDRVDRPLRGGHVGHRDELSSTSGATSSSAAWKPSASESAIPSGRSRNRKCRSACSPNGTSARRTLAG